MFKKQNRRKMISEEIMRLIDQMKLVKAGSDEYKKMAVAVSMLEKALTVTKGAERQTWIIVIASLVSTGVIALLEVSGHSITSKAWPSIIRGRV